jgi:hypothetical protein
MEKTRIGNFSRKCILEVSYEQLVSGECMKQDILNFLSVSPMPLSTHLKKQNTGKLSEIIVNYDELKTAFRDTHWQYMFDE